MASETDPGPVRILHLSDIHFRAGRAWDSDPVLRALTRRIAAEARAGLVADLVALTGDLAYSGTADDYALARHWLEHELWPVLTPDPARPLARDRLLLVPGNHDTDRARVGPGVPLIQDGLLKAASQDAVAEVLGDEGTRGLLLGRHQDYLACYDAWLGRPESRPWWQRALTIRGQRLHLAGLDSAWMSRGDTDRGCLLLGRRQINETVLHRDGEGADWRIALLHHPWDYLAEFDGAEARRTLHLNRDLILRGHLHTGEAALVRPPDPARACLEVAAGCLYDGSTYPNAFQWIELLPGARATPRRVRLRFRLWNQGDWQEDRNQPGCPDGTCTIDLPLADGASVPTPSRKRTAVRVPARKALAAPSSADRPPGPPGDTLTGLHAEALAVWTEKLGFLLAEEAKLSDADQKFSIKQRIRECRAKIRELSGARPERRTPRRASYPASAPEDPGPSGAVTGAPTPDPIRADALSGIADALDLIPALRETLSRRLTGDPAARPADLAERLCAPAEGRFLDAMRVFRAAVADAVSAVRARPGGLDLLHDRAHDILGWMVVTTVMDGYRDEDAPAVRAWFAGGACHIPIGRSLSLEVLSARWLRRQARFGVERGQRQTGEDDITPEHLGETGFDAPETIGQGEIVNAVWRLICQKIDGRTAPPLIDTENRQRLGRRLAIRLEEQHRRLRLVVDPADLRNPLGIPAALRAVGEAIPWLHLMVIAPTPTQPCLFLLPAGILAGDIEACLEVIAALRNPSSPPSRPAP